MADMHSGFKRTLLGLSNSQQLREQSRFTLIRILCVKLILVLLIVPAYGLDTQVFAFRSGKEISIDAIRSYNPRVSQEEIQHRVFEHDGQDLVSNHFSVLNISQVAPEYRNFNTDMYHSSYLNGVEQKSRIYSISVRKGKDYIFVYGGEGGELISVLGPNLQLHPINSTQYPGVFLNFASLPVSNHLFENDQSVERVGVSILPNTTGPNMVKETTKSSVINRVENLATSGRQQFCSEPVEFEIGIGYDSSFCALFDNDDIKTNEVLAAVVTSISDMFDKFNCVKLKVISFDAHCTFQNRPQNDKFQKPSTFDKCAEQDFCTPSGIMLNLISGEWKKTISRNSPRDAAFLFSGYEDGSTVSGATYRAAACNPDLSYAWVEGFHHLVFAHEVGHMLGAKHDTSGIMTPRLSKDSKLELSKTSEIEISRFVAGDARAWCLRKKILLFRDLMEPYGWNWPLYFVFKEKKELDASGVSSASLTSLESIDFITLFSEKTGSYTNLYYSVAANVTVSSASTLVLSAENDKTKNELRLLHLKLSSYAFGIGMAYGNIFNKTSKDIIISHVREIDNRYEVFYHVGYEMGISGFPPARWSTELKIENVLSENIQCASVAIGNTKAPTSTDLLFIYVDRHRGRNFMHYNIGFDLGPDGKPRGGWTKAMTIKGWYGQHTASVSAALHDMDGNGQPELIVYHMDSSESVKIGSVRIGRNMNTDGIVTGGWSDFVDVPNVFSDSSGDRSGTIAVTDIGLKYPILGVAQQVNLKGTQSWNLNIATKLLTPKLLDTAKERISLESLSGACFECYNGMRATQCKKNIDLCPAMIDEVNLDEIPYGSSPEPDEAVDDEFVAPINGPSQPDVATIFCTGFHYFYTKRAGCDVIDRNTVLGKGIELEFIAALREEDENAIIELHESLFEDPSNETPRRKPLAAQAIIVGKNHTYKQLIDKALAKIKRSRRDFTAHFSILSTKITFKNGKYTIRFLFNNKHRNEI